MITTSPTQQRSTGKPPVVVNVRLGDDKENVVLQFDKQIEWLVMPPVMAIKVAEMMKEKAIEILRSNPTHDTD